MSLPDRDGRTPPDRIEDRRRTARASRRLAADAEVLSPQPVRSAPRDRATAMVSRCYAVPS
ncbi:hypothetical protein ACPXCS_25295 [Streptomyces sp. DT190]|uniref:hypothetical protein n=1 Tax=unclassified Streptomyces TaxID=2593676 RepID=UPI003CEAC687